MRFLVGINLRDGEAEHVVRQSAALAQAGRATLDLAYVDDVSGVPSWVSDPLSAQALTTQWTQVQRANEDRLQLLHHSVAENHRGTTYRLTGKAAPALIQAAGTHDAIVLAGRQHSTLSKVMIGSVAAKVVQTAGQPVVVIPARDRFLEFEAQKHRVVFGVDLNAKDAGTALAEASRWAQAFDAKLDLVHVDSSRLHVPYILDPDVRKRFDHEWAMVRERDLGRLQTLIDSLPTQIRGLPRIAEGEAHTALCELAPDYDFLMVATHGRTGMDLWVVGSVAERVMQESVRPVLLLRAR